MKIILISLILVSTSNNDSRNMVVEGTDNHVSSHLGHVESHEHPGIEDLSVNQGIPTHSVTYHPFDFDLHHPDFQDSSSNDSTRSRILFYSCASERSILPQNEKEEL